jgi:predicted DNA-binding WGR domain protein
MRKVTLTYVDAVHNHHKFWIGEVMLDGNLKVNWGRVGSKGQEKIHALGSFTLADRKLGQLVSEKESKGYRYQPEASPAETLNFSQLAQGDAILGMMPQVETILQRYATKLDLRFDRNTGRLVSQLGVIDRVKLDRARSLLIDCERSSTLWNQLTEELLRKIPLKSHGRVSPIALLGDASKVNTMRRMLTELLECTNIIDAIRALIQAEMVNPSQLIADKAQWVEWGAVAVIRKEVAIEDGRMASIEW